MRATRRTLDAASSSTARSLLFRPSFLWRFTRSATKADTMAAPPPTTHKKEQEAAAAKEQANTIAAASAVPPPESPHPPLDSLPRDALLQAKLKSLEQHAAAGDAAARSQLEDLKKGVEASAQQHWGEREGMKQAAMEDAEEKEKEKT
jgi:hypothetical protein